MTVAEEYLKKLQEREPQLFAGPLKKSPLTDEDLLEIEKALGYALPGQYREFLQSYQLTDMKVPFPPDDYGEYYVEWHNISGGNAADWLKQMEESDLCVCDDAPYREAGYLYLGETRDGYYLFYDLVDGTVGTVYHEEIYDMIYEHKDEGGLEIFEGGMPEKLREIFEDWFDVISKDFNDFLCHICLGEDCEEDEWLP